MNNLEEKRKLLKKVLFIGGDPNMASTRIRTMQIASHLGCDFVVNSFADEENLEGKEIFILNKAFGIDREKLRKRGKVILDVIDPVGIPDDVDGYIFSTETAQKNIPVKKPSYVIYQHHMNFSNIPNPLKENPTEISFLGDEVWYPKDLLPPHKTFFSMYGNPALKEKALLEAYRQTDILLNFRTPITKGQEHYDRHVLLNGGMKVINAMAFGIPSLSPKEPAFVEVGTGATLFSTLEKCRDDLERLKQDRELYLKLREEGLKKSREYSIETAGEKFLEMFQDFMLQ